MFGSEIGHARVNVGESCREILLDVPILKPPIKIGTMKISFYLFSPFEAPNPTHRFCSSQTSTYLELHGNLLPRRDQLLAMSTPRSRESNKPIASGGTRGGLSQMLKIGIRELDYLRRRDQENHAQNSL